MIIVRNIFFTGSLIAIGRAVGVVLGGDILSVTISALVMVIVTAILDWKLS